MPNLPTQLNQTYSTLTISSPPCSTYSLIGVSSTPRYKEEMWLINSFVASFILNFAHLRSMAKSALQFMSTILDILRLFIWFGDSYLSTLVPHNSMPYMRHYIPHIMVSSRLIKLRENPLQKLPSNLNLNEAVNPWSKGCTTLETLGSKKAIVILLTCKVENQMIHPYQFAQRNE